MYSNKISNNKHSVYHKPLLKIKSDYDKLEKEMNKLPSDYDGIKELVESKENSITKLQNDINNKMKPTNPNAHTYVNGTDVKTHGYAVTHNTFLQ